MVTSVVKVSQMVGCVNGGVTYLKMLETMAIHNNILDNSVLPTMCDSLGKALSCFSIIISA